MYLNSHVLEVMSSPADQIPEPEDGAVQMVLSVEGASFQIAVVRGFKDVGSEEINKAFTKHMYSITHQILRTMDASLFFLIMYH